MSARAVGVGAGGALVLAGCGGAQSVLDPAGLQASRTAHVWWIYFDVCAVMYVLVMAAVIAAVLRHRAAGAAPEPPGELPGGFRRGVTRVVAALLVISSALLVILMLEDFRVRGALHDLVHHETMSVRVTGRQ